MDAGEWGEVRPLLHPYLHRVGAEAIFATVTGGPARRFDDLGVLQVSRAFELLRDAQRPWPQPPSEALQHVD